MDERLRVSSRAGVPSSLRVRTWLVAVVALVVSSALGAAPVAAAAVPQDADAAGAATLGATSYTIPAGSIFAAPWGSDGGFGGLGSPVRTVARALMLAPPGGTVVLRSGSYNEHITVTKTVTIQNYPGETAWIDGSTSVDGWVQDGGRWRHDGWTTRFDHSPTYTKGAPDSTTPQWRFINPDHPMAAYPDQVFLDGAAQKQVASLAQVGPGGFYLDEGSSRLYLGSDPGGKQVLASNEAQALNVRAAGVVVRGIGLRRFAPSVWHVGAVTLEQPDAVLENVVISDMATTGLSVQAAGAKLRKVTVQSSGMLGIHGRYADNLSMTDVSSRGNNTESFNIAPVSGGVKLGKSRGVTVANSSFVGNNGPGFWEDQSVYNSVFRGSNFTDNAGDGLFLEISSRVVVGDSLFAGNALDGIKVNNVANAKIWNNTFVGNGRSLDLVQDDRRNTNPNDAAVDTRISWPDPEMPWQLDSVTAANNVVALPTAAANCLLCVEDYSHLESGEAMKIAANGNVYVRFANSAPTWLAVWSRGAGNPYVFTTLAGLRSTTGQEARGREYIGSGYVTSEGALASGIQDVASQIALPLPSDVAGTLGRVSGSTRLGMWGGGSGTTAGPTPTSTPSPTPTATSTAPSPPLSTTLLAQDSFSRAASAGWGTADTGGGWTVPAQATRFAVADGAGQVTLRAGDGFGARLNAISSDAVDARVAFSLSQPATGAGHFTSLIARDVIGVGDYRAKVGIAPNGDVSLWVSRTMGGNDAALSGGRTGLSYRVGDALVVRVQAVGVGPTTMRARVWRAGAPEPSTWAVTASDVTSSLQTKGSVGFFTYTSGSVSGDPVTTYVDEFHATTTA